VIHFYMVAEMSGYKNPPVFSKEKLYDRYVEEIRAWCIVTKT